MVGAEAVSPKVGDELTRQAAVAVLIAFGITLIYLAWRFEWRFALATILATMHDIVATLAFMKYLNLEISLFVVGAILTVIGYSMNDKVVVFDRVRENLKKAKKIPLYDLLNQSVNETLPRTVMTGSTTLACLLALLIFGGDVIRPFAWVLIFGIVIGTFSSIYVASPILLWIERKYPRLGADKAHVSASQARAESTGGIGSPADPRQQDARRALGIREGGPAPACRPSRTATSTSPTPRSTLTGTRSSPRLARQARRRSSASASRLTPLTAPVPSPERIPGSCGTPRACIRTRQSAFDLTRDLPRVREHLDRRVRSRSVNAGSTTTTTTRRATCSARSSPRSSVWPPSRVDRSSCTRARQRTTPPRWCATPGRRASAASCIASPVHPSSPKSRLDAGWYVSFSGVVTFRKWTDDDLIRSIPD